ncbi:MAG: hypothetical protein HKO87_06055, partial [Acidimicrobiia bacterium]|nr:hypothetical protein [Acidimicrobiia bacterium]
MQPVARPQATEVSSFDIFDTLLTRKVGEPRSLFLLLGRRLQQKHLIDCSSSAFAAARTDAEIRSFRNAGGLDSTVTIETIYGELASSIWVAPGTLDKLIDEELALEWEMLVPVVDGARRVEAARSRGERITFVSDMYLGPDFLTDVLRAHELFRDGDQLFVSSAHGRSKSSGRLWEIVIDASDVDAVAIHHTGNDLGSDVRSARRAGLAATGVPENNLNRYELALEAHSAATDGLTSAVAGASRLARLGATAEQPDDQVLADVAAGAIAPFILGKVLWLLGQARDEGLEALYFIARDGKLLREVAVELAPKLGYHGELHYLYGSRQAWTLPSLHVGGPGVFGSLCPDGGDDVATTVRRVLRRAEIDPVDVEAELSSAGFERHRWEEPLGAADCGRLRSLLTEDGPVRRLLEEKAGAAFDITLRYLEQEGLLVPRPVGIVDLGTGATLYNSLSAILSSVGRPAPTAFYLGLRAGVPDDGHGYPLAFLHNALDSTGFVRTPGLLTLLEMVCTDDHGSVAGYRETEAGVEAVFGDGVAEVAAWG